MAKTYDLEDLVRDVKAVLQAKLNAQIDAVENEKVNGGTVATNLDHISNTAYHEFAWNDSGMNEMPALGIFVAGHNEESTGPYTRAQYTLEIGIVLNTTNDPLVTKKMLRYMRALRQTVEQNWGKINNAVTREKIETIGPIDFTLNIDSSDVYKIAGISITCVLG